MKLITFKILVISHSRVWTVNPKPNPHLSHLNGSSQFLLHANGQHKAQ